MLNIRRINLFYLATIKDFIMKIKPPLKQLINLIYMGERSHVVISSLRIGSNSKGQFSRHKFREEIQIVIKAQLYVSNCLTLFMEKYILFTCSSQTRKVKEKQANTRSWALSPQALIDLDLRKTKPEFKFRNIYIKRHNIKQFKNKRKSRNGGHTVQEQII